MSTWSYFAPKVLYWLLVSTSSLPAGENLNTGEGALDHDRVCGQRVPNDTRLTMPSQPISWCAQLAGVQNELDCTRLLQRLHALLELDLWLTLKTSSVSLFPNAPRFTFYRNDARSTPKQGDSLNSKIDQSLTICLEHRFP